MARFLPNSVADSSVATADSDLTYVVLLQSENGCNNKYMTVKRPLNCTLAKTLFLDIHNQSSSSLAKAFMELVLISDGHID